MQLRPAQNKRIWNAFQWVVCAIVSIRSHWAIIGLTPPHLPSKDLGTFARVAPISFPGVNVQGDCPYLDWAPIHVRDYGGKSEFMIMWLGVTSYQV